MRFLPKFGEKMVKFGKKWCFFLKLVSRGRLWSTGDGCFKPKIEEPLKTERNSGQFRFIEKMAHVRFIEQPKPKPAGALFVPRGLRALANCGTADGSWNKRSEWKLPDRPKY